MARESNYSLQESVDEYADHPLIAFRDIDALWCPEMLVIPAGYFLTTSSPGDRPFDATSSHPVYLKRSYALGRYPVTFEEYDYFCEQTQRAKPGDEGWGRDRRPVINVKHLDAVAYCNWLCGLTGYEYRLPTEAEWEYACRAGTTSDYSSGDRIKASQANFGGSVGKTTEVGTYPANPWGLHDMHGNVSEWSADPWGSDYRRKRSSSAKLTEAFHGAYVCRGGAWITIPEVLKVSARTYNGSNYSFNFVGLRVARTLQRFE